MIVSYLQGSGIVVFYSGVNTMYLSCIQVYPSAEKIGELQRHYRYVEYTGPNNYDWVRLDIPTNKHRLYSVSPQLSMFGMLA